MDDLTKEILELTISETITLKVANVSNCLSEDELKEKTGLSEEQLNYCLEELEKKGYIRRG